MSREGKKGNIRTSKDGSGWATQPGEGFSDGAGDIHDTFHVDAEGNVTEGHTTNENGGNHSQKIDWD